MKKIVLLAFVLVLLSTAVVVSFVRPAVAGGTIYIRADGSVEGTDKIISSDNFTYTFTDNIYDEIVVERDNIVVDGAGYTLQGTGFFLSTGIDISRRRHVTIQSVKIRNFGYGIMLEDSSNNTILRNNIANNTQGIQLSHGSSNNTIAGNNITANNNVGVWLYSFNLTISGNNNIISGNNITNNEYGITLERSSDNTIAGNNITNNWCGIYLDESSSNVISGNNITANFGYGILPDSSSNNTMLENNIAANNVDGIKLYGSSNNTISGNNITNNNYNGISISDSSNNFVYHNNFINNTEQVYSSESTNIWDNGVEGNYWSDYTGKDRDGDGIGDSPYVIDENNQDNYPLMSPWSPAWSPKPPVEKEQEIPLWMQWWLWTIVAVVIVALAGAVYFLKKRKPPTPTAPPPPTEDTLQNIHHTYSCHSHLQTKTTQNINPLKSYLSIPLTK